MQGNDKIRRFFDACDELVSGKYVLADKKIPEILKAIAASKELYELFAAVTEKFDYPAAKRAYLKYPSAIGSTRGAAYLPAKREELLAFAFCLLVDLDSGALRLGEFLLRYFYVDGSYTASFTLFCERLICPFRDIVKDCFPTALRQNRFTDEGMFEEVMGALAERIPGERARLQSRGLTVEDSAAAEVVIGEISAAAVRRDIASLKALLTGYRYLLRCVGAEDEASGELFALAAKLSV